jgi:hypothetical protein
VTLPRNQQLLIAAATIALIYGVLGGVGLWSASRVVAFVRDIPNRFVIDEDQIADSIGEFVIQGLHAGLNDGDPATQLKTITYFSDWIQQDEQAAAWLQSEFQPELITLSTSSDPEVAAAAADLLATIRDPQS